MAKNDSSEDTQLKTNPFLMGRNEAADRYGHLAHNAATWRAIAFGLLICCIGCVAATIYYSTRFSVVPYIVQVDSHSYEIAVKPLAPSAIDSRMVISRLARYVRSLKTVYSDSVAQMELMQFVHNTTADSSVAQEKYRKYYTENNPLESGQEATVLVAVNSVLSLSESKWQIEWQEEKISKGRVVDKKQYRGIFDTMISTPKAMKEVIENPLGIFVKDFTFTEITY